MDATLSCVGSCYLRSQRNGELCRHFDTLYHRHAVGQLPRMSEWGVLQSMAGCREVPYSRFMKPFCQANTAACVRSAMCSLLKILPTCPFTVFSLSTNFSAIAVLEHP